MNVTIRKEIETDMTESANVVRSAKMIAPEEACPLTKNSKAVLSAKKTAPKATSHTIQEDTPRPSTNLKPVWRPSKEWRRTLQAATSYHSRPST